jgi:pimeloyl-ACP methyl ester carboxylesterase
MSEWSEGFVAVNDLKVFYHRTGPGSNKPSLLLLHGFTDNGLCWSRVARDLEESYDVIMTDARGHGHTEGPADHLSIEQLAEDAAGVIRALGLEKPYLFGHSMGAMTALAVAVAYPDLVKAIVLEDPPFMDHTPPTAEEKQQFQESAKASLAFQALPLSERIATGKAQNPNWSDDEILPWAESKGEYNRDIMNNRGVFRTYPWREAIARVGCPVLLITAETEKGAIVKPEVAQEAARLCKHCQLAYISGAGHCIHRDRYAETMQVVLDFLR